MADEIKIKIGTEADTSGLTKAERGTDALAEANERLRRTLDAARQDLNEGNAETQSNGLLQKAAAVANIAHAAMTATREMGNALREAAQAGDAVAQAQLAYFDEAEQGANRLYLALAKSHFGIGLQSVSQEIAKLIAQMDNLTEAGRDQQAVAKEGAQAMAEGARIVTQAYAETEAAITKTTDAMRESAVQMERQKILSDEQQKRELAALTGDGPARIAAEYEVRERIAAEFEAKRQAAAEAAIIAEKKITEELKLRAAVLERAATPEGKKQAAALNAEIGKRVDKTNAAIDKENTERFRFEQQEETRKAEQEAAMRQARERQAAEEARVAEQAEREKQRNQQARQTEEQRVRAQFQTTLASLPAVGRQNLTGGRAAEDFGMGEIMELLRVLVEQSTKSKQVTEAQRREVQALRRAVENARINDNPGGD